MNKEVFYYYLKDESVGSEKFGHPYGCVAMTENEDGTVNKGISYCSANDHFDKRHARGLALSRLHEAEMLKSNKAVAQYHGSKSAATFINENDYIYVFHIKPTEKEIRIMHKPSDL